MIELRLLPCPFCGKPPKVDAAELRSGAAWAYIRCDNYCGIKPMACGSANTHYYDKPFGEPGVNKRYREDEEAKVDAMDLAIKRWNTRGAS